jgi:hypothetical protein
VLGDISHILGLRLLPSTERLILDSRRHFVLTDRIESSKSESRNMFGLQETLHMRSAAAAAAAMKNLKEEPAIIGHHHHHNHHQLHGSVRNWMQPTTVDQAVG